MKATELMIGDWVLCDKNAQSDYEFDNVNYQPFQILNGNDIDYAGDAGVYQPIPLTEEILEKNGFVKELDKDNIHYRFGLTEGCTFFSVKYARSVFQWLGPLDFKYVHELQHALRLCGVEKDITI